MSDIPSTKPYMIRAIYEWCLDCGFTPHLAVVVGEGVRVPRAFVRDGQIVLNIAPHATNKFELDNEAMSCQARFGGVAHQLHVPIDNILAIYARENGQGMSFEVGAVASEAAAEDSAMPLGAEPDPAVPPEPKAADEGPDDEPPSGGGRPRLRIVK